MSQRISPFLPGLAILLLWWTGWLGLITPFALMAIKLLGLLLAAEVIGTLLGDRRNRALLVYRWQSRNGRAAPEAALRLAETFDLLGDVALDRDSALRAMADMAERAVRLNLRHPNPISGPLTLRRLNKAMQLADAHKGGRVMTSAPLPLAMLWPQPSPDFSIGGIILDFRRFAGRLILRRAGETVRHAIAGERAIRRRMPNLRRPQQRWRAADFPQHEIFYRASRMSMAAGLPPWNDDPALLPLRQQFRLAAVTALLTGGPDALRRARLLAPFSGALIDEVLSDLDRWAALHGPHPLTVARPPAAAPLPVSRPAGAV